MQPGRGVPLLAATLFTALLAACAGTPAPPAQPPGPGAAPATWSGEIPCADCAAQRLTVTLFNDGSFRLRRTYAGRGLSGAGDVHVVDLGRWAQPQDGGRRLALRGGAEAQIQFRLAEGDVLRLLDANGREITSGLNYDLARQVRSDRIEGPYRLRGMYTYMADAATFNECLTGKRYPVLPEGEHAVLQRAYLSTRGAPGEFIAAIVSARFVERAPEPGQLPREHLLIEGFERVLPGATCAPQAAGRAELLETYWRPVEIDGKPVLLHAGTREPHLVLAREGSRLRGYAGCNSMAGGYVQQGEALSFGRMAVTRRACIGDGTNELESAFLAALEATAAYRIIAESLELRDKAGKLRMKLEARYLR
jgi:copper homeostasis protein (lipoprotein)